jgi:hypothetical protein
MCGDVPGTSPIEHLTPLQRQIRSNHIGIYKGFKAE